MRKLEKFAIYTEHANGWLKKVKERSDQLLAELEAARDEPALKIVDGCPVGIIREVKEDGTDVYLGDVSFVLSKQLWELEGTGRVSQETPRRDPSDPDVWSLGGKSDIQQRAAQPICALDYLAPSHHRQGIMSDAFQTLLRQWAIPRMGVRRMAVTALEGNEGSVGVLKKNGFKFRKTIGDALEVRGTMRGVHVLDWRLEDEAL